MGQHPTFCFTDTRPRTLWDKEDGGAAHRRGRVAAVVIASRELSKPLDEVHTFPEAEMSHMGFNRPPGERPEEDRIKNARSRGILSLHPPLFCFHLGAH